MQKTQLINYLNDYLKVSEFKDSSKNWLQVDNTKTEIKKIGYAVDATNYIFQKWIQENVDLILVHHGLFRWFEQTLIDVYFERVSSLIKNDIALYACHLPLDAHEEVWNNIWLAKWFIETFNLKEYQLNREIEYAGEKIGFWLKFNKEILISDLEKYLENIQLLPNLYNFWNLKAFKSIAFCSGWALSGVKQAFDNQYDIYLTWEWVHHEITFAKDLGQTVILGWHRETEKIWPSLLAKHLEENFDLEIVFLDEKY